MQGEVKSLLNSEDSIVEIQLDRLQDAKSKLKEKFSVYFLILDSTTSLQCKMDANNIPLIVSLMKMDFKFINKYLPTFGRFVFEVNCKRANKIKSPLCGVGFFLNLIWNFYESSLNPIWIAYPGD